MDAPISNEEDGPPENLRLDKRIQFYIDGKRAAGFVSSYGESGSSDGVDINDKEIRLFKFQDIVTTGTPTVTSFYIFLLLMSSPEDETLAPLNESGNKELGSIEVRIQRIRVHWDFDKVAHQPGPEAFELKWEAGVVNERSKNLGAHCTGYVLRVSVGS